MTSNNDDSQRNPTLRNDEIEASGNQIREAINTFVNGLYTLIKVLRISSSAFFAGVLLISYGDRFVSSGFPEDLQILASQIIIFLGIGCFSIIPMRLFVMLVLIPVIRELKK